MCPQITAGRPADMDGDSVRCAFVVTPSLPNLTGFSLGVCAVVMARSISAELCGLSSPSLRSTAMRRLDGRDIGQENGAFRRRTGVLTGQPPVGRGTAEMIQSA